LAGMEHHRFPTTGKCLALQRKSAGFLRKLPLHGAKVRTVLREYTSRQQIGWYNC
jgi:hypothetical protein